VVGAQVTVTTGTVAGIAVAITLHDLSLLVTAAVVGQTAGHLVQLGYWHRAGLLRVGAAARIHLPHITVGAVLGSAGALGCSLGGDPVRALCWGLAATLLAALVCSLFRSRIPLYKAAVATGLLRSRGAAAPGGGEGDRGAETPAFPAR
jgi:hypothetical protein